MVKRESLLTLGYYKKAAFTGGNLKMRYRIAGKDASLCVSIWRGPLSYEATEEEKFTKSFSFTEEGLKEACDYINAVEEEKSEYFDGACAL